MLSNCSVATFGNNSRIYVIQYCVASLCNNETDVYYVQSRVPVIKYEHELADMIFKMYFTGLGLENIRRLGDNVLTWQYIVSYLV